MLDVVEVVEVEVVEMVLGSSTNTSATEAESDSRLEKRSALGG